MNSSDELVFTKEDNSTFPAVQLPTTDLTTVEADILALENAGYVTNTANNLTNYYNKGHADTNFLDGLTLSGKRLTVAKASGSSYIDLPIADAAATSPFAGLRFVDSNENTITRGTIAAQISNTNVAGDPNGSNITLDGGLEVTGSQTYTTEEFIMDSEDGYGVLEIYFGDVSGLANGDTLFKLETTNYRNFTTSYDGDWGDTEFKINSSNNMYLRCNQNSNDVIRVTASGYPSAGIYFIHDTSTTNQNPAGYGTNLGRLSNASDIGKAREAAGAVQLWNDANDNYNNAPGGNPGGTSGLVNDHYFGRGDSLLGLFRNNRELQNYNVGGLSYFATWKGGPEFLNGGSISISSNDHIMIRVNRQSIEYFKNGNMTPVHTQSNSGNQRVGGVTDLRKKLIIGNSSNNSNLSFTVRKFKWHGNQKSNNDALSIYEDRDFVASGGSSVSNVDLTPYFNGVAYNNSASQLTLQSASGNSTVTLRDCYTKAEANALISAASSLIAGAKFHKGISTTGPDGSGVNTVSEDFGFSSATSSGGNKITTSLGSGGSTYVTVLHNIVFTFGSGSTATPLSIYDYHVSVTPNYTSASILYYGVQQQGYASFKVSVRVLWSGSYHNDPFSFKVAVFAP